MWGSVQWPGGEHLDLRADAGGVVADGVVLAAPEGDPIRLAYRVECDADWRTRFLSVHFHGDSRRTLVRDDAGNWSVDGRARPDLNGCTDIDIALTPFTNTLPIRRLGLAAGGAADLRIVYVQPAPEPLFSAADQRYTRLADDRYRYESGDFRSEIEVDRDGLVTAYPGLWVMAS